MALLGEDRIESVPGVATRRDARERSPGRLRLPLPRGMRERVLISFMALLILSTAASVLVLREVLLSRIDDEVGEELAQNVALLKQISQGTAPGTGESFAGDVPRIFDAFLERAPLPDGAAYVTFRRVTPYKQRTAAPADSGLADALRSVGPVDATAEGEVSTAAGRARYAATPILVDGRSAGTLIAGQLLSGEREQVEGAVQIAIGVSIVVMLLASLFIWLAAGRAVAPLQALARAARGITESDLSRRLTTRGEDEIAQLGRTFNEMLDRLELAFANQKEFLADVSHELRTPITVIRGYIETLGDDPRDRDEAIAVVQDELDRMNRYVDDLLLLVRAPRPDFLRPQELDLDLLTHDIFAKAQLLGEREWMLHATGVGLVHADAQRLTQAIMNLADNAVRHTVPGQGIAIGSSYEGDRARLWVRDEGPGLEPAEQEKIFKRFAHADRDPAPGSAGLGLAIVQAIARAHGGFVEVASRPGVGSTFTIEIPAGQP